MKNVKLGIVVKSKKVKSKTKEVKVYNDTPEKKDEFFKEDFNTYVFHPSLDRLRDQILQ